MKKTAILIFIFTSHYFLHAQTKSTGIVSLDATMSMKLDLNKSNSAATITLTGPVDRWFGIGFHTDLMYLNADCLLMTSNDVLSDMYFPGGHLAPLVDVNNWEIMSNSVETSSGLRTVTAIRSFINVEATDYGFDFNANGLNIIYAYSSIPGYELISHGSDSFGGTLLTFTNLANDTFSLEGTSLQISQNPFESTFQLLPSTDIRVPEPILIQIFDIAGRVLETQTIQANLLDQTSFGVNYPTGTYFVKITFLNRTQVLRVMKK